MDVEQALATLCMHIEGGVSQEVADAVTLVVQELRAVAEKRSARVNRMLNFMKSSKAELEKYGVETMGDLPPESQSALESLLIESLIEPDDDIQLERG